MLPRLEKVAHSWQYKVVKVTLSVFSAKLLRRKQIGKFTDIDSSDFCWRNEYLSESQ